MGELRGLVYYEIDVLRCVAGEDVAGLFWGAAMSEAIETLKARKLVFRDHEHTYRATEEGRAILRALEAEGRSNG